MLIVCLIAAYLDPVGFLAPRQTILIAQVVAAYMLEDTASYVPEIIKNILMFWYVFMQLSAPYSTFVGVVIGLMLGMLSISTPRMIGFDLFFPPSWLIWLCERFLNPI